MNALYYLIAGLLLLPVHMLCQVQDQLKEEGLKTVNSTELHYAIYGEGQPVVVLHGGPGFDHAYLMPQMATLGDEYRLIFYDQRGAGGKFREVDTSKLTIETYIEDLEGIRKAFGLDKMHILGHSWGGVLGMFYAIAYPERVHSLMLVSSGGATDFLQDMFTNLDARWTPEDSATLSQISSSEAYQHNEAKAVSDYYQVFFKAFFHDPQDVTYLTTRFSENTLKNRPLIYASPLFQTFREYDIRDRLHNITCPTLIIHGEYDPIPLSYVRDIHAALQDSRLIVLEECGHFPYIERPDELYAYIRAFMDDMQNR